MWMNIVPFFLVARGMLTLMLLKKVGTLYFEKMFFKFTKLKQALCKYFSNIVTKLTLISILRH